MQQVLKVLATKAGYALLQWFIICHGEIEKNTLTYWWHLFTRLIAFHISLIVWMYIFIPSRTNLQFLTWHLADFPSSSGTISRRFGSPCVSWALFLDAFTTQPLQMEWRSPHDRWTCMKMPAFACNQRKWNVNSYENLWMTFNLS